VILGIGIDMEDIERVRLVIDRHGQRFLEKVYTPREIAYVEDKANRYERYAARFAAKEAAMKALGTGWNQGVQWKDLEIVNSPDGCPSLKLAGGALSRAMRMGYRRAFVSMSHTRQTAIAQVIIED
jgi:holo-[acyl-carrier protein] synthase